MVQHDTAVSAPISGARTSIVSPRPAFVPGSSLPLAASLLLLLSLADGLATLGLLSAGLIEVNPVMRALLALGTGTFLGGKMALTIVGIALLAAVRHRVLWGGKLRILHILLLLTAVYATVLAYEFLLWSNIQA